MTYEELEKGLVDRGFVGIDGVDSMGDCHKDNKHYVLRTDGLIIYSNIPYHTDIKYYPPNAIAEHWGMEDEFTWEKLDEVMSLSNL